MSKLQQTLISNMLVKITQDEKSFPNKALFRVMRLLNFQANHIRKAIITANDIRLHQLVTDEVSLSSLYTALSSNEKTKSLIKARQVIANAVGIEPDIFWQEDDIQDIAA